MQDYVQGEITLQVDKINRLYHVLDPEQSGIQVNTTPGSDIVRIQYNMTYDDMALLEQNLKSAGNFIRLISNIPDTNGNGDHANQEFQGEEFFSGPQAGAIEYPEEHQYDQGQIEYGNTGYSRVYEENYNQPPVGDPHAQYYDDNQYQGMNSGRKPQNPNPQMRPDMKGPGINQPPATMKRGPQYPGQGEMMRGNPNLYDPKVPNQGGQNFKQYPNQPQPPQNPPYQPGPKGQPQQPPTRRPGPGGYQENPRDPYYQEQGGYYQEMGEPDYYQNQGPKGNRPPNQGKPQQGMNPVAPQGGQGGRYPQGPKQPQVNQAPQMMPGAQNQPYYGKAPQGQPQSGRGYPGGPQQRFPGEETGYPQNPRQLQGGMYQDEGPGFQQYPSRGGDKWAQPAQGGNNSGSNQGPGSKNSGSSGAQRSQGKPQVQSAQNTPNINYGHTGSLNVADKRGSGQAQARGASANYPRGGHQGTGNVSAAGSQSGRGGLPTPVQSVAGQLHSSQKISKQQAANQSQQWGGKGNQKGMRDDGSVSSQSMGQSVGPESFSGSINPVGSQNPQRRGKAAESQEFGSPAISPPPAKDVNLPKERFIDDTVENINRKPGFNKLKKKSTRRAQLLEEYLKGLAAGGGEAAAAAVAQPVTSIGSISNMRVDMGSNVLVSSVALTDSNKVDQSQHQSAPSVPHLDFTEQFDEEEDEERRRREAEHRAKQVANTGALRQPLGEVGESDEINNDPEEQLESDGEEEEDFYGEEQFDPEFGEEEQPRSMPGPKEQPIAGGRFLATPGLHMSEVSRPKITNKGRTQPNPNDPRGGGQN